MHALFKTLALCTTVILLRPFLRAYSNAKRAMRLLPSRVFIETLVGLIRIHQFDRG